MFGANKYKLLAEECLKLAKTARDAHEERALLEIAWGFAQLACEACETVVPERGANQSKEHDSDDTISKGGWP